MDQKPSIRVATQNLGPIGLELFLDFEYKISGEEFEETTVPILTNVLIFYVMYPLVLKAVKS